MLKKFIFILIMTLSLIAICYAQYGTSIYGTDSYGTASYGIGQRHLRDKPYYYR